MRGRKKIARRSCGACVSLLVSSSVQLGNWDASQVAGPCNCEALDLRRDVKVMDDPGVACTQ